MHSPFLLLYIPGRENPARAQETQKAFMLMLVEIPPTSLSG